MSFYVLKDVDWAWDDEGEGRAIVVRADSPEQAVKIATEKHIAEFPGAGGVTWDVGRLNFVAFGDAMWGEGNKPSYEPLTYYSDGINGPPDRDPARILSATEPAGVGVGANEEIERHSTHHVHRGPESLPCYCAATSDHAIGKEKAHKQTKPGGDQ